MIKCLNHVTIVVSNVDKAINFFSVLGFKEKKAEVLSSEKVASSMGIQNTEGADHIALSLNPEIIDSMEIQLLHYRGVEPEKSNPPSKKRAFQLGYDHIAFEVEDIEQVLMALRQKSVKIINDIFIVGKKKLAFIEGPDGVTIELAELI